VSRCEGTWPDLTLKMGVASLPGLHFCVCEVPSAKVMSKACPSQDKDLL
jgi:hypothetical protein